MAETNYKIVLIGIGGMEWSVINSLRKKGELKNISRIVKNGVYGDLKTLENWSESPAIWTSIFTGLPPERHGIWSFQNHNTKSGKKYLPAVLKGG